MGKITTFDGTYIEFTDDGRVTLLVLDYLKYIVAFGEDLDKQAKTSV